MDGGFTAGGFGGGVDGDGGGVGGSSGDDGVDMFPQF